MAPVGRVSTNSDRISRYLDGKLRHPYVGHQTIPHRG
jgi:hypothetical protein